VKLASFALIVLTAGFILTSCGSEAPSTSPDSSGAATTSTPDAKAKGGSLSNEEKYKLYTAMSMSGSDTQTMLDVLKRLGLTKADGTVDADAQTKFNKEYTEWSTKNTAFIVEMSDQAKAKAYLDKNK
jgi:hypothetical protein